MNLRQLAAEVRSIREDLKAIRTALEKQPPAHSCCSCAHIHYYQYPLTTYGAAQPNTTWYYNFTTGNTNTALS